MNPELKALLAWAEAVDAHAEEVLRRSRERRAEIAALAAEAEAKWAFAERKFRARGWVPPEERAGRVA